MTRIEKRLAKAKKIYPIGTEFTSAFGANDVVTQHERTLCKNKQEKYPTHYVGDDKSTIFVSGKYEHRIVYLDGRWSNKYKDGKTIRITRLGTEKN